jgi:hypothetical protein
VLGVSIGIVLADLQLSKYLVQYMPSYGRALATTSPSKAELD